MKILLVASEIHPFAKTGGLADITGLMAKVLREKGHDIRMIMPKYKSIDEKQFDIKPHPANILIPIGTSWKKASLFECLLHEKAPAYFIGNDPYYDRDGLYGNNAGDFPDNAERFIFFSRAVLEACKTLAFQPDIIHCHDWQTGLIPVYLKSLYAGDDFFKNTRTVFTIHNLGYQGNFWHYDLPLAHLPWELFTPEGVEFYGKFSFLKSGLVFADKLTTVSPTYAKEILTAEFGFGLDGVLRHRSKDLHGILNGADYEEWNPEQDALIKKKFSPQALSGKQACRKELIRAHSLKIKESTPILCMVSRFTKQKGIELIMKSMDMIMENDVALIILGAGEKTYHDFFVRQNYPGKFSYKNSFSEAASHQIIAGSDIIMVPSQYEPCGLTQIYGLKYGTVPLVRAVGGLDDTVKEFSPRTSKGNGFKFKPFEVKYFLTTLRKAVASFKNKQQWQGLMAQCMSENHSWDLSAEKYVRLYNMTLKIKQPKKKQANRPG